MRLELLMATSVRYGFRSSIRRPIFRGEFDSQENVLVRSGRRGRARLVITDIGVNAELERTHRDADRIAIPRHWYRLAPEHIAISERDGNVDPVATPQSDVYAVFLLTYEVSLH